MAFRVGQKIACVNDEFYGLLAQIAASVDIHISLPSKGGVYTVREITNGFHPDGRISVRLQEIINPPIDFYDGTPPEEPFFSGFRFRPLIERKTDTGMAILRKLLNGNKIEEKV